jgi:hypothetical protein
MQVVSIRNGMSDAELLARSLKNIGQSFRAASEWLSLQGDADVSDTLQLTRSNLTTILRMASLILTDSNGVADAIASGAQITGTMPEETVITLPDRLWKLVTQAIKVDPLALDRFGAHKLIRMMGNATSLLFDWLATQTKRRIELYAVLFIATDWMGTLLRKFDMLYDLGCAAPVHSGNWFGVFTWEGQVIIPSPDVQGEKMLRWLAAFKWIDASLVAQHFDQWEIDASQHGSLCPGQSVCLYGLMSSVALNGKRGVLLTYDSGASRWQVQLPSNGKVKLVKEVNLVHVSESRQFFSGAPVIVQGLKKEIESNGCVGTLGIFITLSGRWEVKVEQRTMSVKPENLMLLMGDIQGDRTEVKEDFPLLCVCCLDNPALYVMQECGHACCCDECRNLMTRHAGGDIFPCPLCRRRTSSVPVEEFHGAEIFFP